MKLLNEIDVLEDGEVVRVGTGNRWKDVYAELQPLNKSVVGGRNGDVGVGGFLMGGLLLHFIFSENLSLHATSLFVPGS